ncbi:alpha/beta hydrolase [Streptomyces sp. B1866]|uniref:alpha/beta hydrolase n=1 Tax=Streptomyces sp. B1866 TaxID=3075431 RepID=UPI00288D1298|nr:alpha/beta hydrolase [Streptomyces sp. B1866]MDT3396819.1 alpha/beta hydrolase [Streptomyces sp. B1866]
MVSFARLRALKPAEFEDSADGWRHISNAASAAKDRVEGEISARLRKSAEGEGAAAALERLRRLSRNFHYIQVETGLVSAALNGLAAELRAAKKKLDDAVADAEADRFTVKDDGSVHWVSRVPSPGRSADRSAAQQNDAQNLVDSLMDTDPRREIAQGYANRIGDALKEATEADATYARTLDRLTADNDLDVTERDWADAQGDMGSVRRAAGDYLRLDGIPKGRSPKENAAWWKGLSERERADYTALFPAAVGALDGIPAAVRDEANRVVLDEQRGACQLRLNAIPPEPANKWTTITSGGVPVSVHTDEWVAWNKQYGDRYRRLQSVIKGMDAIQHRFDQTGEHGLPEAYLLAFDPKRDGRAIIATGNPDKAHHTAVYVPGTGSDLSGIEGSINRMNDLWRDAHSYVEGQGVSTIAWLGYDAPDDVLKDAIFSHYANDGAPALNGFIDGLHASREPGTTGHTTVIGHSYGTTLIGSAARQGELNADDVIFAGSPGVQVGSAEEMDAPRGHVWNEEADGDQVPDIGRDFHGGTQWEEKGGRVIIRDSGVIPSDDSFGANQMATDTSGHRDYWKYGSLSLKNQARVVAGRYDMVKADE